MTPIFRWARRSCRYLVALLVLGCFACSSQPKISKDSPEYPYTEARQAFVDLKHAKALGFISDVLAQFPDSDYAPKARALRLILLAGLSSGYCQMAEAYLAGFEKSIKNSGLLRSTAFDYYRKQKSAALGFYDTANDFLQESSSAPVVIECDFPSREVLHNKELDDVRNGKVLDSEHRIRAEEEELRRGILQALSDIVDAGGDRARARKELEAGSKTIDRAAFMLVLGRLFLENQKVFARGALNEVQNYRQFYAKAAESSEAAQKILKDKPNEEIQASADRLKTELEAMEKKSQTALR